jgi:hypothetical protein
MYSAYGGNYGVQMTDCTLAYNGAFGGNGGPGGNDGTTGGAGGFGYGGALFNLMGQVVIADSTLDANWAVDGGTLNLSDSGPAGEGGAVYNLAIGNWIPPADASLTLYNSILADSTGSDLASNNPNNANQAEIDGDSNLISNAPQLVYTSLQSTVIKVVAKPNLGPLQNNGGLTPTMAVGPGSPAFGKGNPQDPLVPPIDQRGKARLDLTRPAGKNLDLGAFEWNLGDPTMIPILPPFQFSPGDVTGLVVIQQGKAAPHGHGHLRRKLTLRNTSAGAWTGPVWLALDGLSPHTHVRRAGGPAALDGRYVELLPPGGIWLPGETLVVTLDFLVAPGKHPHYTLRVLAGPGIP